MPKVRPMPANPQTNLTDVPRDIRDQMGVPKGPDGKALKPTPSPPAKKVVVHPSGRATVKIANPAIWVPSELGRRRFLEDAIELGALPARLIRKPVDLIRDVYQGARDPDALTLRHVKSLHPASTERMVMEALDSRLPGVLYGPKASQELARGPLTKTKKTILNTMYTNKAISNALARRKVLATLGLFGLGAGATKMMMAD